MALSFTTNVLIDDDGTDRLDESFYSYISLFSELCRYIVLQRWQVYLPAYYHSNWCQLFCYEFYTCNYWIYFDCMAYKAVEYWKLRCCHHRKMALYDHTPDRKNYHNIDRSHHHVCKLFAWLFLIHIYSEQSRKCWWSVTPEIKVFFSLFCFQSLLFIQICLLF